MSLSQAHAALVAMRVNEALYKMASTRCQRQHDCVEQVVDGMAHGITPDVKLMSASGFYRDMFARLQLFFEFSDTKKGKTSTVRGKDALDALWQQYQRGVEEDKSFGSLATLEPFSVYKWLLDGPQLTTLAGWVKRSLQNATESASASSGSIGALLVLLKAARSKPIRKRRLLLKVLPVPAWFHSFEYHGQRDCERRLSMHFEIGFS